MKSLKLTYRLCLNNYQMVAGSFCSYLRNYISTKDLLLIGFIILFACNDWISDFSRRILSFAIILFISIGISTASIITVIQSGTGDYTTIQEAYDNANSGDTILVYPGVYYENVDISNTYKDITLGSLFLTTQNEEFIHSTIIDGNHTGSCLAIRNTLDSEINVVGFTLEHGSGYNNGSGGGIYIKYANPTIKYCLIQYNTATSGAGISMMFSTTTLAGNTIRYNHSYSGAGGINCIYEAIPIFDQNNLNNIYLNYATFASDIATNNYSPPLEIYVDTFSVYNPDYQFIMSIDEMGHPIDDISINILNNKIDLVNSDLFVNPTIGSDSNDGLSFEAPLKTISHALLLIASDSLSSNTIYLSNGTYSPNTNNEKFAFGAKSYVSIQGESMDSTILSADTLSALLTCYPYLKNFSLKNVTLENGYGHSPTAGIYFNLTENVKFNNVILRNCHYSSYPGIRLGNCKSSYFSNFTLTNISGGTAFNVSNNEGGINYLSMINCEVSNCRPDSDPETGRGGGIQIGVPYFSDGSIKGAIINLRLSNNQLYNDEIWGISGAWSGLGVGNNTEVTLINATINGNVTENDDFGAAIVVGGASKLDIYNSIFYGDSIYELGLGTSVASPATTTANVCYSNLEGGESFVNNWYNQYTLNWLEGNINSDPMWDTSSATPYALPWNSPCVDAGVPMYESGMDYPYIKLENEKIVLYKIDGDTLHLPSTDLAGNPRIFNERIDMGAYEFQDTGTRIKELSLHNIKESTIDVYPNPFYTNTYITFKHEEKAYVQAIIYDLAGKPVKKLMDAQVSSGEYTMIWDGDKDLGVQTEPGTYILSISVAGQKIGSAKIVKTKFLK